MPTGSARVARTAIAAPGATDQRHRLGGGRGLVQHRRAGDGQAGEVGDHRLEVQQRLEPALADLRLVRRVRGVPTWVLQDPAQDDRRGDGVVVAEADHRPDDAVLRGERPQLGEHRLLVRGRRQVEPALVDGGGNRLVDQIGAAAVADDGEHLRLLVDGRTDVPTGEAVDVRRCHGEPPGNQAAP